MNKLIINSQKRSFYEILNLNIVQDLVFEEGGVYRLEGLNGSGKSTFVSKILIPEIKQNNKFLLFYLSQDFHLQFYSIQAYAAYKEEKNPINSYEDAVFYFLEQFLREDELENRTIFFILDEIEIFSDFKKIINKIQGLKKIICFVNHSNKIDYQEILGENINSINFTIKANETVIKC